MNRRTFRCPNLSALVFGLLVASFAGAAVAGDGPRFFAPVGAAFHVPAPPQTMNCLNCAVTQEQCFATCFAETGQERTGACLTACNNAAATCTCDGTVTLRSEELAHRGLVTFTESATCNPVVSCQPNYPSCASWSSFSGCGEPWCEVEEDCPDCSHCPDPPLDFPECLCDPGPARHDLYERFRVCFNQFSEPCVEWQRTFGYSCGCESIL